jgi:hypothetical protein
MVHERDEKYEGQEDGEYHFSDDQANYEMEPDEAAHSTETKVAAAPKSAASGGIEQYKRPLIGVTVFVVLIFLVYKITAPSGTAVPGDITQGSSVAAPAATVQKPVAPANTAAQSAFQPLSRPLGMSASSTSGAAQPAAQAPAAPVEPVILTDTTQTADQLVMPAAAQQPAPAINVQQSSVYNPAHPSADINGNSMVAEPAEVALLNQKITALTQQNAKMQMDYSQKIADYESQNTVLQAKVQDLSARLANMETTLAHLGRAVQQDAQSGGMNPNRPRAMAASGGMSAQGMMQSSEPKAAYTVSAIIPGRAWLKSEGGETVTVAEGDTLKGYGRIMKIDPYDGVVELDVGGKIVALSYGATGE